MKKLKDELTGLSLAVIPSLLLASVMAGCSSTSKVAYRPPYCTTAQTIEVNNGSAVSSRTLLECTDDDIKKLTIVRAGVANNCSWDTIQYGNKYDRQLSCQQMDGKWVIVPESGLNR
jgi:hypothetical protein